MTAGARATIRPFDPGVDFPAVAELITAASRHANAEWFPTAEGLAVMWKPAPSHDPVADSRVAELDGRMVGLVRSLRREREATVSHRTEVYVHPDVQRQGLGTRLLAAGENRAREVAAQATGRAAELPQRLAGSLDQANTAAVAFATRAGYEPFRFHNEMRRDLSEPIPEPAPLPDGLELRAVLPEHHRAIWDANVEAFRDHWDSSVMHEEDFVRFFAHPNIDTSLWLVAWHGEDVAGMVLNGIMREENAEIGLDIGWLDEVATLRRWRKRGLASALIPRSLALLKERGMAVAALGVDTENPSGALGLYERFGFRAVRTIAFYRKAF